MNFSADYAIEFHEQDGFRIHDDKVSGRLTVTALVDLNAHQLGFVLIAESSMITEKATEWTLVVEKFIELKEGESLTLDFSFTLEQISHMLMYRGCDFYLDPFMQIEKSGRTERKKKDRAFLNYMVKPSELVPLLETKVLKGASFSIAQLLSIAITSISCGVLMAYFFSFDNDTAAQLIFVTLFGVPGFLLLIYAYFVSFIRGRLSLEFVDSPGNQIKILVETVEPHDFVSKVESYYTINIDELSEYRSESVFMKYTNAMHASFDLPPRAYAYPSSTFRIGENNYKVSWTIHLKFHSRLFFYDHYYAEIPVERRLLSEK